MGHPEPVSSSDSDLNIFAGLAERYPAGDGIHRQLLRSLAGAVDVEHFCRRAGLVAADLQELSQLGEQALVRAGKARLKTVSWFSSEYPALLREIPDPPFLLYARGDLNLLQLPAIGIVGARRASAASRSVAEQFGGEMSALGIAVVSGMAMGVDRAAQEGALTQGTSIAVLGTGADVAYPQECSELHRLLGEKGLVLSEYSPGTRAHPRHFPARNRIIAGLSRAVVVVQAALRSGSLITARLALEYGREVFAVPGDIRLAGNRGSNRLLLEGAVPALEAAQVLLWAGIGSEPAAVVDREPIRDTMAPQARCVLRLLEQETLTIDELVEQTGMDASPLNALLIRLEAEGWVRQEPGRRLVRIR